MIKMVALGVLTMAGVSAAAMLPWGAPSVPANGQPTPPKSDGLPAVDSLSPLKSPVNLLFIHHSVGGALLAERGPQSGALEGVAIYDRHPAGAGVRSQLSGLGYQIHEASYQSIVGHGIDMFDWVPKFRDNMDRVLSTKLQDETLPPDQKNQVVMFETCYNSNRFKSLGKEPGKADGGELTLANAKAVFRELLEEFAKHPDVLFVHITASPAQARYEPDPVWKALARFALGKPQIEKKVRQEARIAREFNTWLASPEGWLSDYPHDNVVVFNFYDLLTDYGKSDALLYSADPEGFDPHPNAEGQEKAARNIVPFVHEAVLRRVGESG